MIRWITYIPTHYNSGQPIPQEKIDPILKSIAQHYGGYTLFPVGEGAWITPQGGIQREGMRRLEVIAKSGCIEQARYFALELGEACQQNSMYFETIPTNCEFLDIQWNPIVP
jgi:hypothetical protein